MGDPAEYAVTNRPSPSGLQFATIVFHPDQPVKKSWLGYGVGYAATEESAQHLITLLRRFPADAN